MGNSNSTKLSQDQLATLQHRSNFTKHEIEEWYNNFVETAGVSPPIPSSSSSSSSLSSSQSSTTSSLTSSSSTTTAVLTRENFIKNCNRQQQQQSQLKPKQQSTQQLKSQRQKSSMTKNFELSPSAAEPNGDEKLLQQNQSQNEQTATTTTTTITAAEVNKATTTTTATIDARPLMNCLFDNLVSFGTNEQKRQMKQLKMEIDAIQNGTALTQQQEQLHQFLLSSSASLSPRAGAGGANNNNHSMNHSMNGNNHMNNMNNMNNGTISGNGSSSSNNSSGSNSSSNVSSNNNSVVGSAGGSSSNHAGHSTVVSMQSTTTTSKGSLVDQQMKYQELWQKVQEQQSNMDQLAFRTLLPTIDVYMNGNVDGALEWGFQLFANHPEQHRILNPMPTTVIKHEDFLRVLSVIFKMLDGRRRENLPVEMSSPEACAQLVLDRIGVMRETKAFSADTAMSSYGKMPHEVTKNEFIEYCHATLNQSVDTQEDHDSYVVGAADGNSQTYAVGETANCKKMESQQATMVDMSSAADCDS